MGKLIVIEGACDGIGKTTQYEELSKKLLANENEVTKHHFPTYNSYQGKGVEKYLQGEFGKPEDLSPYFINCLYATDRAITWYSELKEKYDDGNIILLDRYTTSSLIYQSAFIKDEEEKKRFLDYVVDFEYNKLGVKRPDIVIFLYADFDIITEFRNKRKENEGISNDIHESNIEYMRKFYDSSMFVADYMNWTKIKCDDGKGFRKIEDISKEIFDKISNIKN